MEIARFKVEWLNQCLVRWLAPLLKADEDRRITGATYMVIAGLIAFLLFDTVVAVSAMLFLALGDPAAALVGRRMPGPRLFGKSPIGTIAFLVVSLLIVEVLVGSGRFPYHWALLVGGAVAALVELAPVPPDDNLTIPLAAGGAMHLLGA
jgi:dolichol kinase